MFRVAIESVLGLSLERGNSLRLTPHIPDDWPGFKLRYRLGDGTVYEVEVSNPNACAQAVLSAQLDGIAVRCDAQGVAVPLAQDGGVHRLLVVLGHAV
jgi:cyclic beta-1,2-glucan synthetase